MSIPSKRALLIFVALCMMAGALVLAAINNGWWSTSSPSTSLPTADITLAGHPLHVEVATTPAQWGHGLMDRRHLARDHGMLFVFPSAIQQSFWMKDTLIPLDILFFDASGTLVSVWPEAQPCRRDPCRLYPSGVPARYVLELPAGAAAGLRLAKGARLGGLPSLPPSGPATP